MMKPSVRYLAASPHGDVPVDNDRLDYPLEGDPLKISYQVYFQSIRNLLTRNNFSQLLKPVKKQLGSDVDINEIIEIIIRTEKHGALYHPASIEVLTTNKSIKFGLNVAVTDKGKDSLLKEFELLTMLYHKFNVPYLPKPYFAEELNSMVFLLEEWFEDYHEFHIAKTEDGQQQIKLWEYGKGNRFLSSEQGFEIYRQAAQILTLYYDLKDFRLIYPWHHAAGDFVVHVNDGSRIDVRLTTVRGYESFMGRDKDDMVNPAVALFYFLLHLSIQMRLDRLDGIGNLVWSDDSCVDATIAGFLEGLEKKKDLRDCCGSARSFLMLLKSFKKEDLRKTFVPVAEQFKQTKDYRIIQGHLKDHADKLYLTLQNFP
jgi:hypothetical protein